LWSRSYFAATVGAVSEATIRSCIEAQKGVQMPTLFYKYRIEPNRMQAGALSGKSARCVGR